MLRLITAAVFLVVSPLLTSAYGGQQQLGSVAFSTSCAPAAKPDMARGVALLHSFQYQEAREAFSEAGRQDSKCAMCHWGSAMTVYHPLWGEWPSNADFKTARQEIRRAERTGPKTRREQLYIASAAAFFKDRLSLTPAARITAWSDALRTLHREFPQDADATAFYALSLVTLAVNGLDDLPSRQQAIALLQPLFREYPNHPGIAHYLIHAADRPELASLGLEAARKYADIAPDSSHALHMPSHIFVRLGLWEETIALNLRAAAAGAHAAMEHQGDYTYQIHAMDFLRYAYTQRGEGERARALTAALAGVPGASDKEVASDRTYFGGLTAIELHQWAEAAALPVPDLPADWLTYLYWARTIGAARSGDGAAARNNLEELDESFRALLAGRTAVQPSLDQPIMRVEAEAWVAFGEGRTGEAINMMRGVADREASNGGESIGVPAREMLADMQLALDQPGEALATYENVLTSSPSRFNALYGAAQAARQSGDRAASTAYLRRLLETVAPDGDRPEIGEARRSVTSE